MTCDMLHGDKKCLKSHEKGHKMQVNGLKVPKSVEKAGFHRIGATTLHAERVDVSRILDFSDL